MNGLPRGLRDSILFIAGIVGVIHETVTPGDARPLLLGIFAAMLGLPLFMHLDEKRQNGSSNDDEPTA